MRLDHNAQIVVRMAPPEQGIANGTRFSNGRNLVLVRDPLQGFLGWTVVFREAKRGPILTRSARRVATLFQ